MMELQDRKIIIYGAGVAGHQIYNLLLHKLHINPYAFCDTYKSGTDTVSGLQIMPSELLKEHLDALVIVGISDFFKPGEVLKIVSALQDSGFPGGQILKYTDVIKLYTDGDREEYDWQKYSDGLYDFDTNLFMIEHMSRWIDDKDRSIVDLGAGIMNLKRFILPDIQYFPVDYKKRFPETVVADFNKGQFPGISADVYFLCAMLYYANNPQALLEKTAQHAKRKIIISLHSKDMGGNIELMRFHGFKSYIYTDEVSNILGEHGFKPACAELLPAVSRLCLLYTKNS